MTGRRSDNASAVTAMGLQGQRRRDYLSMAELRAGRGAGTHRDVLRERTARYPTPLLNDYLGDVPFAVVGGIATRLYMQERATLDVDALVSPMHLGSAEAALETAGATKVGSLTKGGSSWRLPDGSSLDVLAPDSSWTEEAVTSAVSGPDDLPYVRLPFLVLMKLVSGRLQDLADISRMLGAADEQSLRETRDVVLRYRPQDAEDLESMVRLGKLEYEQE